MDTRDILALGYLGLTWGTILLGLGFYGMGHGW